MGFSSVVAPLSTLTKKDGGPFRWDLQAEKALEGLKQLFSSAPIPVLPDPSQPFIVEVDASNIVVGVILSQRWKITSLCLFLTSFKSYSVQV